MAQTFMPLLIRSETKRRLDKIKTKGLSYSDVIDDLISLKEGRG